MDKEIRDAMFKLGILIIGTGSKLKRLSKDAPNITEKDLTDIHNSLLYCLNAVTQISQAKFKDRESLWKTQGF